MTITEDVQPQGKNDETSIWKGPLTVGNNGVAVSSRPTLHEGGYRSYEIHQRQRLRDSTEKIKPSDLISREFQLDPYPALEILRENYPCYRDWLNNAYWITRYDDVTSVFTDDANFETRSKLWFYQREDYGRDLGNELPVLKAMAAKMDAEANDVAEEIVGRLCAAEHADLAVDFAAQFSLQLLGRVLALPESDLPQFALRYWRLQRGYLWEPKAQMSGVQAMDELSGYFDTLLDARRADPGDDLISTIANLDVEGGKTTGRDVVVTLLEADHETLHGALANLWFLLLTNPEELARLRAEPRLLKFAYFEALRHSAPVLSAKRFARHEVERFGYLIPEGALLLCSAAAANRDPRVFEAPDEFRITRTDLCQREPRGQYRADGLPSGIAFGPGKPSKFPAVPEDRPRSCYALTRDMAVTASQVLLDSVPNLRLADKASPILQSLQIGEMHTCWKLPAVAG